MTLDPLRDPVLDRVGHEAGHLAGLRWFGYTARIVRLDVRYADFGHFGALDGVHGRREMKRANRSTAP